MRQLRIVQAVIFNGVTRGSDSQKDYDADTSALLLVIRAPLRGLLTEPKMITDAFRLDDKVALVTGASKGIGACIASTFAPRAQTLSCWLA